jgi:DNA repair exonuclease SbcCD ATPase subunit
MKINFNFVEATGFRSIVKPLHFDLQRPGLNLIKGINGAGKTSIFEALVWCLYGVNLKDTNLSAVASWPEIRTSQWQGTRVTVCLTTPEDTYYIYRHLGYKGLTHDVKGEDYLILSKGDDERENEPKMIGDFRNKTEMQVEINRILGMDAKTFTNSVLFGQRMAKLIESDNGDKRKLFETIFETEWVTEAKLKCDTDIGSWTLAMSNLDNIVRLGEHRIESLHTQKQQIELMAQGFEENRSDRIRIKDRSWKEYVSLLDETEISLITYEKALKGLKYDAARHDKLDQDYDNIKKQIQQTEIAIVKAQGLKSEAEYKVKALKIQVETAEKSLKVLTDKHIEGNCPYCEQELLAGNKLEVNHKKEITAATDNVKIRKKALKEAESELKVAVMQPVPILLTDLDDQLKVIEEERIVLDGIYAEYADIQSKMEAAVRSQTQIKKDILRTNNEIDSIKAEVTPQVDASIDVSIKKEQDKLVIEQQNKLDIEKKLEIAKWWSSRGFGAGGIKAYIFTAMLSQLNENVKKYGDRLGASLEFSIDLTKASKPFTTICSLGDKLNKDYKDFSGGQKQKLDIALLFAMHDLISMNIDMNILIMDEVFEGLSEDGETAVFDLIKTKAEEGKSVYVITHSAVLDSLYANTIEIQSINNNTVIL